jgi:hypothetical protein
MTDTAVEEKRHKAAPDKYREKISTPSIAYAHGGTSTSPLWAVRRPRSRPDCLTGRLRLRALADGLLSGEDELSGPSVTVQ